MSIRRTNWLFACGAGLAFAATPAHAEWMNGSQLNDTCTSTAPVDRAMCLSYVMGVLDGYRALPQPPVTPDDISAGKVRDVVVAYMTDHPEILEKQGRTVVKTAIADAWPKLQPKAKPVPKRRTKTQ
ncbi:Rap1a/Tai family immunity protein [Novosphingobium sp. SL115]|uniref:Rap1a/Tai family immunity protein n=1 Tax=Novosphingobium sp. SL115 TaxID=2995150 RepID=UPI002273F140|nr:Rap1a/Tai family immunity protein [Novosphingobium sp. SL115]MCY1672718.1 Rap1a/Tai family immunity protein [Novosphingobium sp. SL115]